MQQHKLARIAKLQWYQLPPKIRICQNYSTSTAQQPISIDSKLSQQLQVQNAKQFQAKQALASMLVQRTTPNIQSQFQIMQHYLHALLSIRQYLFSHHSALPQTKVEQLLDNMKLILDSVSSMLAEYHDMAEQRTFAMQKHIFETDKWQRVLWRINTLRVNDFVGAHLQNAIAVYNELQLFVAQAKVQHSKSKEEAAKHIATRNEYITKSIEAHQSLLRDVDKIASNKDAMLQTIYSHASESLFGVDDDAKITLLELDAYDPLSQMCMDVLEVRAMLGFNLLRANRPDEAIQALTLVIDEERLPDEQFERHEIFAPATIGKMKRRCICYINLGACYMEKQQYDLATEQLQEALIIAQKYMFTQQEDHATKLLHFTTHKMASTKKQ